jgi:hypothetical protein
MKGPKALLLTLAMTAALLALAVGVRRQYAHLAAEHWRRQLGTVPDDRADILLRQVAELGEPGIPVLVEALGSERESVAQAGKRALWEQLDRWQMLGPSASSPNLAALADALAEQVERFGPTARNDAADLATRVLLWPLDPRAVDRPQVIASCEKVLQATAVRGGVPLDGGPPSRQPLADEPDDAEAVRHHPATADDPMEAGRLVLNLNRLPGGGLPIEPFQGPAASPQGGIEPGGRGGGGDPRPLAPPPAARPLSTWRQPDRPPSGPQTSGTVPNGGVASDRPPGANAGRVLPLAGRDDASAGSPAGKLSEIETLELMRWLDCRQEARASAARKELMRRGFTQVHLELARRLFDPDPEARKRLARLLPGIQSVDAAPWLLWLSHDPDPEVRRVAIGLIATTGDATLLEQIEQAARQDPDPQIQRQAELIAERRSTQRR